MPILLTQRKRYNILVPTSRQSAVVVSIWQSFSENELELGWELGLIYFRF